MKQELLYGEEPKPHLGYEVVGHVIGILEEYHQPPKRFFYSRWRWVASCWLWWTKFSAESAWFGTWRLELREVENDQAVAG